MLKLRGSSPTPPYSIMTEMTQTPLDRSTAGGAPVARSRRVRGAVALAAAATLVGAGCDGSTTARQGAVLLNPAPASRRGGPFFLGDRVALGTWWVQVVAMSDPYQANQGPAGSSPGLPTSQPSARPGARLIRIDVHVGNQGSHPAGLPAAGAYRLRDSGGTDDHLPVDVSAGAVPALPSSFAPGTEASGSLLFSVANSDQPTAFVFRPSGAQAAGPSQSEIDVVIVSSLPH